MMRSLVLFEDRHWADLRPLTDLAPVPALAFGASNLAVRWRAAAALPLLAIEARDRVLAPWRDRPAAEIEPTRKGSAGDEVLVINAAALPGPWLDDVRAAQAPAVFSCCGRIVAARLPLERVLPALGQGERFESVLEGLEAPRTDLALSVLAFPWHFIEANDSALAQDLTAGPFERRGEIHRLAALEAAEAIAVEEGARIEAFAVLDARGGPIRVGRGARVHAHTIVTGPCVIGAGSELLGGSVSRSTIGPRCYLAGEIEACIWQGFANKRHHGFVGHSVIGEWANLGALTTTSDLKNNYGAVRVWVGERELESGLTKVGAFIGAHTKTGIGSLLPTGASVGTGSNLFGGGRFAPKRVPAFSWWDGERMSEHRLDQCLATARHAMARRERPLGPADEQALRALFEDSAADRRAAARAAGGTPAAS